MNGRLLRRNLGRFDRDGQHQLRVTTGGAPKEVTLNPCLLNRTSRGDVCLRARLAVKPPFVLLEEELDVFVDVVEIDGSCPRDRRNDWVHKAPCTGATSIEGIFSVVVYVALYDEACAACVTFGGDFTDADVAYGYLSLIDTASCSVHRVAYATTMWDPLGKRHSWEVDAERVVNLVEDVSAPLAQVFMMPFVSPLLKVYVQTFALWTVEVLVRNFFRHRALLAIFVHASLASLRLRTRSCSR